MRCSPSAWGNSCAVFALAYRQNRVSADAGHCTGFPESPERVREGEAVTEFLVLCIALSSPGWIRAFMGISSHRGGKKIREQERSRTAAGIAALIPREKRKRSDRRRRRKTWTVRHPAAEFTAENRTYRLQSTASLPQRVLPVGGKSSAAPAIRPGSILRSSCSRTCGPQRPSAPSASSGPSSFPRFSSIRL